MTALARRSRHSLIVSLALALVACGGAAQAPERPKTETGSVPPGPPKTAVTEDARCAVWSRELSFAASVAAHDERTFVEHLHPQAMFVEGEKSVTRGREAVLAEWRPLLTGESVLLRWHPTSVVVAEGAGTAVSRGPYVIEDPRPNATSRYMKGLFQSVWVKDADGAWRVLIDGGTARPTQITNEEAERIKSELSAPCVPGAASQLAK